MKTTLELVKGCAETYALSKLESYLNQRRISFDDNQLEAFRKDCEADFISRCMNIAQFITDERRVELIGHWDFSNLAATGHYPNIPLYTLPKE